MVELVYFGDAHAARAPGMVGTIYSGAGQEWVTPAEIFEAMELKIPLIVRPASESEMKRMEAIVSMYEIGAEIAQKIGDLLDQNGRDAVASSQQDAAEKLGSLDLPVRLLDLPTAD